MRTSDAQLNELGEFLKARRAELSPRTAGLPGTGRPRRVAGLRREEVARLAAIELAGEGARRPRRRTTRKARPLLRRLLDDLTATPAMVLGSRLDIVAWNPLAAALLVDFAEIPERKRNYVRLLFTEPAMRERYPDWANVARGSVASLRAEAASPPGPCPHRGHQSACGTRSPATSFSTGTPSPAAATPTSG